VERRKGRQDDVILMGKMNARGRLFGSATRAWRRKADGSAQRGGVGSDNDGLG
jgi:hypothetical protein